jgi:membrane protein DedA with SNARE-associated domain
VKSELEMKHLAFYYTIGFAIAGILMLILGFSVFDGLFSTVNDPLNVVVLALGMILPFVISALSWRDWGRLQKEKDSVPES